MSSDGKSEFQGTWHGISRDLLREQPWSWRTSPTGSHKAINQSEVGDFFRWISNHAMSNGGVIARNDVWEEWARADLEPHDKTLDDIKRLGLYGNTRKRVKKAITDNMKHLVFFGLFEANKDHEYTITKKGRLCYGKLFPDQLPIAAE